MKKPYVILSSLSVALIVAFLIQSKDSSQTSKSVVSVQEKQNQVANSDEANTVEVHVESKFAD